MDSEEPQDSEAVEPEKKPPSPIFVFLMSLFGYPGVGHLMVGAKRLGLAIIVVFTILSIGVVYEIWVMVSPILDLYRQGTLMDVVATQGIGGLPAPTWWRIILWLVTTGIVWLGAAVHSLHLAKQTR